ncbi:hypothetical protein AruPA_20230 [Acidiphilium sp. PA]|uniref:hypothetical protein n=1 Tax=Acidiphilium sp. PA TaxID=2871705 RepID=UPI002243B169|nr:hypothetical protein [Acidiphilium sp. PA]MCW8309354.1 hypothetical protein [Acidiphilium sp. PA]
MNDQTRIKVRYSTVDRYSETREFDTIEPAREFAQSWLGRHPEMGCGYAISGDGIGKIEVAGTTLATLFPEAV